MDITFADQDLKEYAETGKTKSSKYKKYVKDAAFSKRLVEVVTTMKSTESIKDLAQWSWLHYEALKRGRGRHSVRVMNGRAERLIFVETEQGGISIEVIELNTTHYGNKK